jgi:hypothetical protein
MLKSTRVLSSIFSAGLLTTVLAACNSPSFKPEISGDAISSRGGVIYSLPAENPVLKMKVVSLGVKKDMLRLRLYFVRKGAPANEYLDPREQFLYLPDSTNPISVSKVHAPDASRPLVKLSDRPKQTVELMFPIPSGTHNYPYVEVQWKVHFSVDGQPQVMAQKERFDIIPKNPQASVGSTGGDPDFPFEDFEDFPGNSEWGAPGLLWW